MMQRVLCTLLGALAGAMLVFPQAAFSAAEDALTLFVSRVAPALFPVIMTLLLLTSRLPVRKGMYAVLSLLSGSPGGSRLCASLPLNTSEKRRFAALNGTLSPGFLLSVLPRIMGLSSGFSVLLCHMAGAVITCLFIPQRAENSKQVHPPKAPLSLASAATEAGKSLLIVCGCMVFSCVLMRMLQCALPFLPLNALALLHLLIEITGGLQALQTSSLPCKELLCVCFTALGGLSILMQNAAFWQKNGVSMGRLFLYRSIHALISSALYVLLFYT